MNHRLSVRLTEALAWGIEALAKSSGKAKSEIVRDALTTAGIGVPSSTEIQLEALRRAAAKGTDQPAVVDAAALIREVRDEMEGRDEAASPGRHGLGSCAGRPPGRARATGRFQAAR